MTFDGHGFGMVLPVLALILGVGSVLEHRRAWLAVGPDDAAVRQLVTAALHHAKG